MQEDAGNSILCMTGMYSYSLYISLRGLPLVEANRLFVSIKTLKMQGEKEENKLTVPACNCLIDSGLFPSGTVHTDEADCWRS